MNLIDSELVDVPQVVGRVYTIIRDENTAFSYDDVIESVMGYMSNSGKDNEMLVVDPSNIDIYKNFQSNQEFIHLLNNNKIKGIEEVEKKVSFNIRIPIAEKPSSYPQVTRNRYNAKKCKACSYCYKTLQGASRCINMLYADLAFLGVKSNTEACIISMNRTETSYTPACGVSRGGYPKYKKATVNQILHIMDYLKNFRQFYVSSSKYRGGHRRRGYTPLAIDVAINKLNDAFKYAVTCNNFSQEKPYKNLMRLEIRPSIIMPNVDDIWFKLKEAKLDAYHQIKSSHTYMTNEFKKEYDLLGRNQQVILGKFLSVNLLGIDAYNFVEVLL